MNMMVSELYDALLSAGAEEAKARRAAEGFATSDQEFRKQFSELREDNQKMRTEMASLRGELKSEMQGLRTDMGGLRGELKVEMQGLRTDMGGLRGELSLVKWMGGVLIGMATAILLKVLFT